MMLLIALQRCVIQQTTPGGPQNPIVRSVMHDAGKTLTPGVVNGKDGQIVIPFRFCTRFRVVIVGLFEVRSDEFDLLVFGITIKREMSSAFIQRDNRRVDLPQSIQRILARWSEIAYHFSPL
jgi:hypothetical protein